MPRELRFVFDAPPGPDAPGLIGVEDEGGRPLRAGLWREAPRGAGFVWELVVRPEVFGVQNALSLLDNMCLLVRGLTGGRGNEIEEAREYEREVREWVHYYPVRAVPVLRERWREVPAPRLARGQELVAGANALYACGRSGRFYELELPPLPEPQFLKA